MKGLRPQKNIDGQKVGLAESARLRIKSILLLDRVQNHALGRITMTQSQLYAALALLKKTIPDLSTVEFKGHAGTTINVLSYASLPTTPIYSVTDTIAAPIYSTDSNQRLLEVVPKVLPDDTFTPTLPLESP